VPLAREDDERVRHRLGRDARRPLRVDDDRLRERLLPLVAPALPVRRLLAGLPLAQLPLERRPEALVQRPRHARRVGEAELDEPELLPGRVLLAVDPLDERADAAEDGLV